MSMPDIQLEDVIWLHAACVAAALTGLASRPKTARRASRTRITVNDSAPCTASPADDRRRQETFRPSSHRPPDEIPRAPEAAPPAGRKGSDLDAERRWDIKRAKRRR